MGDWEIDNNPFSAAKEEDIPETLISGGGKKGFGLGANTAEFSAQKQTNRLGIPNRKVSQGHINQTGRGSGQTNTLAANASAGRTRIVPGAYLSTNQATEPTQKRTESSTYGRKNPDFEMDQFESAAFGTTGGSGKSSGLQWESKRSSNYQDMAAARESNSAKINASSSATISKGHNADLQTNPARGNRIVQSLLRKNTSPTQLPMSDDIMYMQAGSAKKTSPSQLLLTSKGTSSNGYSTFGSSSSGTGTGSGGKTYGNAAMRRQTVPVSAEAAEWQRLQAAAEFSTRSSSKSNAGRSGLSGSSYQRKPFTSPELQLSSTASSYNNNSYNYSNSNGYNYNNANSSDRRTTRRQSKLGAASVSEVIDLVDSDDDITSAGAGKTGTTSLTGSTTAAQRLQDSEIMTLYGALPGFSDPQKRLIFGNTQDRIMVERIYLGIYGFENDPPRKLYIRVDANVNQCILLGLNERATGGEVGEKDKEKLLVEIEEIPFEKIKKIFCGRCSKAEHGSEAFIALSVMANLTLNSIGVGMNCMLSPTLTRNSLESAKYVLILCSNKALEAFKVHLNRVPVWQQKKNFLAVLDKPSKSELENFLFAHIHSDMHSVSELRRRAADELERRQKSERRALKRRQQTDAVLDPTDCITHMVYPIEPEVLDAITIFKGDLKRLKPGEYLNDNLIDLKIKHLFRNMPEQDRARIHCFNCMFYTRLTAEGVNKFEAGHALVSRWTKNVDIFSKDFILIPINYSYHWSLAVIVRPGALLADLESLQANLEELMNAPPNSQETNPSSAAKRGRSKKIAADSSEAAASAVVGVEVTNAGGVLDLTSTPRSSASTPTTTAGGVTKGDSGSSMADVMASASARISRHASSQLLDQQGANSSNKKNNSHKGSASRGDGAESDATFEDSNFAGAGGKMDVVTSSPPALVLSSGDHTADNSDAELDDVAAKGTAEGRAETTTSDDGDTAAAATATDVAADAAAEAQAAAAMTVNRTCILHMDSLGMHSTPSIGKWLRSYLRLEWESRKRAELNTALEAKLAALTPLTTTSTDVLTTAAASSGSPPHTTTTAAATATAATAPPSAQAEQIRKQLDVRRKSAFNGIHLIKCKVPMQTNGHDCGLFVTRYAEMILKRLPDSTTSILENKFHGALPSSDFSQTDIDLERDNMRSLIDKIRDDWEALRQEQKEKEPAGADSDNPVDVPITAAAGASGSGSGTSSSSSASASVSANVDPQVLAEVARVGTETVGIEAATSSWTALAVVAARAAGASAAADVTAAGGAAPGGATASEGDDDDDGEDTGTVADPLFFPFSSPITSATASVTPSVRHAAISSSKFAHVLQGASPGTGTRTGAAGTADVEVEVEAALEVEVELDRPADTDFDTILSATSFEPALPPIIGRSSASKKDRGDRGDSRKETVKKTKKRDRRDRDTDGSEGGGESGGGSGSDSGSGSGSDNDCKDRKAAGKKRKVTLADGTDADADEADHTQEFNSEEVNSNKSSSNSGSSGDGSNQHQRLHQLNQQHQHQHTHPLQQQQRIDGGEGEEEEDALRSTQMNVSLSEEELEMAPTGSIESSTQEMDCEEAQSPVLPVVQPLPPSRLIRHHHRDAERDEIHSPSDIMGHSKGHIKGKNKGKNKDKKRKVSKNVFESHSNSSTSSSSDSGNESDIGTGRGVGGGEIATVAQSWTSSRAKATPPVPVPAPVTTAPLPFFPPEKGNSTAAATTPTAKRDARGEVKKEVKKEAAALSAKKDPKSKVPVRQAAIREKGSTQAQVHVQGLGYAKAEVGTREREGAGDGGEDLGEDLGETVCGKQGQDESAAVFQSVVTTIYSNHKGISSSGSGTGCVKALTAKMRTPLQQSQKLELLLHSHEGDDEEAASFAVAAQVRGSGGESAPKSKSRVSHHVTVTGEKKKM